MADPPYAEANALKAKFYPTAGSKDEDWQTIARDPACPPELLSCLIRFGFYDLTAEAAASNPNLALDDLRWALAGPRGDGRTAGYVPAGAIRNPSLPMLELTTPGEIPPAWLRSAAESEAQVHLNDGLVLLFGGFWLPGPDLVDAWLRAGLDAIVSPKAQKAFPASEAVLDALHEAFVAFRQESRRTGTTPYDENPLVIFFDRPRTIGLWQLPIEAKLVSELEVKSVTRPSYLAPGSDPIQRWRWLEAFLREAYRAIGKPPPPPLVGIHLDLWSDDARRAH